MESDWHFTPVSVVDKTDRVVSGMQSSRTTVALQSFKKLALGAFALGSSLFAASGALAQSTQEYVVVLKSPQVIQEALGLPQTNLGTVLQATLGQIGITQSAVTRQFGNVIFGFSAQMTEATAKRLQAHGLVDVVEKSISFKVTGVQNNAPWNLDRIDQSALPLNSTYSYQQEGAGVHIYILDSGLRASHSDFAGRVGNGFDAMASSGGSGGLLGGALGGGLLGGGGLPLGVGFGGLQIGMNTNSIVQTKADPSTLDPSTNPSDCNGHGTHVAGNAAGSRFGVAKGATLHAVRVVNCNGVGTSTSVLAGLDWVVANGVKPAVVNMSLGGSASNVVDRAVRNAWQSGVLVVAASGNETRNACNSSPGREPLTINVSASNRSDQLASYSNFGTCVDLIAPGDGIVSASHQNDNGTATKSGTSMASPHVAGAAAKLLSAGVPMNQIEAALIEQSSKGRISNPNGTPNRLLFSN